MVCDIDGTPSGEGSKFKDEAGIGVQSLNQSDGPKRCRILIPESVTI